MVRLSKKARDRSRCPKRCRAPSTKTGTKKDNLTHGYKMHENAINGEASQMAFIPKIK